ncbi:hypothetical protein CL1_0837 [Thermococcus cleftensis]|uniref:Sulfatase N-terminal domain-containing protein n=1 Tax=Thermococcus cleftensis (strain DSM 27260 / KACC 17922 / CL1) TaxID=163003 RepID=I3ZTK8_THECF|nr:sulfatase-like hydrolase/transferase [Thermococcus cleftensis]AFL95042.1 hypothetical protein CL1_0837 [Thermococcus cleftensis]
MIDKPNIILIILDTLRKDYGEKYLGPMLQELGFVYYPNAIAPSPWTLPTHASIFTGRYPAFHGAHETNVIKIPKVRLKRYREYLPAYLSNIGYHTSLISANVLVQPAFGFNGFHESYDIFWAPPQKITRSDLEKIKRYSPKKANYIMIALKLLRHGEISTIWHATFDILWNRGILPRLKRYPLEKGATQAISILKKKVRSKGKNFIFVNLIEVHEPYSMRYPSQGGIVLTLTGKVTEDILKDWQKGYIKETIYLREKLRDLLNTLQERIDFDNSLIIVTSDHGQLLGEDNRIGHGAFLDDELIRVPLWIKYPESWREKPKEESHRTGYISLTNLYHFVLSSLTKPEISTDTLFSHVAFSESYGSPNYIPELEISKEHRELLNKVEKYRIAIYYKNFKGIFNVTDWKFEEIRSYDPNVEVTEDVVKHMKKEVIKFLKTATVAKVPKIKI